MKRILVMFGIVIIAISLASCDDSGSGNSNNLSEDLSVEEINAEDIISDGNSSEDQSAEEIISEEQPVEEIASEEQPAEEIASEDLPSDEINDETEQGAEFDYSTVKPVTFNLELLDSEGNAIAQAVVIIYNGSDEEISRSVTDSEGKAEFTITINRTEEALKVVVQHPDYEDKIFTIENADDLAAVSRILYFQKKAVQESIVDSDGDGIADEQDEFPLDSRYVSSVSNTYTIAFEDLYPQKGDADFNDLVVRLSLTEYIDADNKIRKIIVNTKVLASGAGYKNAFGINIMGERHMIFTNAKEVLNNNWNSKNNDVYFDAEAIETVIEFDEPVSRDAVGPMPYDPFMIANNKAGREVHLPFADTAYTGQVLDEDGFPWAVLVPNDWQWPKESSKIFKAYPEFQSWYESGGVEHIDWYSYPDPEHVFSIE